ncbi:MAG: hypothetical protein NVS2B4_20160 [Ramlibacter sp.]
MPEGPSIVILREAAQVFDWRRILRVEGNTQLDKARLKGRTVQAVLATASMLARPTSRCASGCALPVAAS